jgi:DNA helicase-2/ATP-dependent DNA helicase PcrA
MQSQKILEGLNDAQRQAVETVEGPLLIVAGPGSGKTRVITHRVAYLVNECGVRPYRILAVTFTNKAANEMKARLEGLLGGSAEDLVMGTFHSFCARLLRRDGHHVGLEPNYTIYDEEDALNVVRRAMEELAIDPKRFPPGAIRENISRAKSVLRGPDEFSRSMGGYFDRVVHQVYERYQALLVENNAVDFDDLLLRTVRLLDGHSEVLERYQQRFLHMLVDEFQDTNIVQYRLARLLAGVHRNICVVGDPDQSIYSWRNADLRNILSFEKDYSDATVVNLSENYRSTKTILEAAKHLIRGNQSRLEKDIWTGRSQGELITVREAHTEEDEAHFVVSEVERLVREEGKELKSCAAMYRVNAQSRALEEACLRYGVRYKLVGGVRFYHRREVKDVVSYLRLLQNPDDQVSLLRIINVPARGLGQRSIQGLARWAAEQGVSFPQALRMLAWKVSEKKDGDLPVTRRAANSVARFVALLKELEEAKSHLRVTELLDRVLEASDYRDYILAQPGGEERWENVQELRGVAQEFDGVEPEEGLMALLERLALVTNVDDLDENDDALTLITLHQAKGLEFPVVFITGVEEGLLPHIRSMDSEEEMEEERRLCYVGITRAEDRLYLLRAFRRRLMGGSAPTVPSRFLSEIPSELINAPAVPKEQSPWGRWAPKTPDVSKEGLAFRAGDRVRHQKFGDGIVVNCQKADDDQEVTVVFKGDAGVKRLLLSFAPLELLED